MQIKRSLRKKKKVNCLLFLNSCRLLFFLAVSDMDYQQVFEALDNVCDENIAAFCGTSDLPYGTVAQRLVTCWRRIQEHGRALEPVVGSLVVVYHHYDFDPQTPGNGYRTLVKVWMDVFELFLTLCSYVYCI